MAIFILGTLVYAALIFLAWTAIKAFLDWEDKHNWGDEVAGFLARKLKD